MAIILYHANCDDGFGAAYAAWLKFGDESTYIPVQYGQPMPELPPDHAVYILDFSYPRDVLLAVDEWREIKVLDHHKTAQEDLKGLAFATFDMEKSGAVLAWEYFHPGRPVPTLLRYVQDRDLWRKEMYCSDEHTAWRRSFNHTFKQWQQLEEMTERAGLPWTTEGRAILRSEKKQIQTRVSQAIETTVGEHVVLAVNETQHFSEVAGELARNTRYPFGACYFIRGDGLKQWSLRSLGDFDVSEVARKLGGGGHNNAAGFTEAL